jgi:hypothetical protein
MPANPSKARLVRMAGIHARPTNFNIALPNLQIYKPINRLTYYID